MRKIRAFFLIFILCTSTFQITSAADRTSGFIALPTVGTVVQIIDAGSIVVRLNDGTIAYVKLLGINADTRQAGLKYMQDNVFGRTVTLQPDYSGAVPAMDGRWNHMYVYFSNGSTDIYGREMINLTLLRNGYAEADENYDMITQYNSFVKYQNDAKNLKMGTWGDGNQTGTYFSSEKININTATQRILRNTMSTDVSDSLIQNIVSYRENNPYKTVSDLKFVNGMTRDIYGSNKHYFSVITNINSAPERELRSLGLDDDEVQSVLKYRSSNRFSGLEDFYKKGGVDIDLYEKIKYFISLNDTTKMTASAPNRAVNVNTASESQLSKISGVSSPSNVVSQRRNGYSFKSFGEFGEIFGFSIDGINSNEDNLRVVTDINTATTTELESLFGSNFSDEEIRNIINRRAYSDISQLTKSISNEKYNRISDYVYVDEYIVPERVNLNRATSGELVSIGMSYSEADRIISAQGRMTSPSKIPFDISRYDSKVSLYTNINTATAKELRSLNVFSESFITAIINARSDQPFGSKQELEDFFEENKILDSYRQVREYIVLR